MTDRPEQPPEGRLIALAQKRAKLSGRRAAELAGMSEGRWRQIVSGYQTVSAGVYAPVRAPAGTLARMAQVVGATAEQLEEARREDAAAELRELTQLAQGADERSPVELQRDLIERIQRIAADPTRADMLDKFTRSIDPGETDSQVG